ncbi:MAG: N-6 DNA methylase [Gammaproteobacteria bacterium]|nr:N-6 DNA methylase [Gammaproteobacteria bacterium]
MISPPLHSVLEATGYLLPDGQPAPGVYLGEDTQQERRGRRSFSPDALWRSKSTPLTVYFKYASTRPSGEEIGIWRQEIWNEGFAPLLWVISPDRIDLYNGFALPEQTADADVNRLKTFRNIVAELDKLDQFAGRLAMETGQFWSQAPSVTRKTSVDHKLLSDLAFLEGDLAGLEHIEAQGLIGRTIFTQYLIDREIIGESKLKAICGYSTLPEVLHDRRATKKLFTWLSETFNGDMFPSSAAMTPATRHLERIAKFLEAVDPETGQTTFFPYQFDVIPVELISAIYEQFVHTEAKQSAGNDSRSSARQMGVYYTRLPVVSLVLDEVMDGLTGKETVLDLTCGSGVFLVEALRRLVRLKSDDSSPDRKLIRSTLYEQIYGVDISENAVRIAAFSLYLAALELDPDPRPPHALKFAPLIGKTLFVGDAHDVENTPDGKKVFTTQTGLRNFDVIVGNPPWSFRGKKGTSIRRSRKVNIPQQPRGEGLDFVRRAMEFSHDDTRFGLILSATPFFSRSQTGLNASQQIIKSLLPVTLVNLSNLSSWLFPKATMPAVAFFARHRPQQPEDRVTLVQVPWTPTGNQSHTFKIARSDIMTLSFTDWKRQPERLKAAICGCRRDLSLLDRLTTTHATLSHQLEALQTKLSAGLKFGDRSRDATFLKGLPLLHRQDQQRFFVSIDSLALFYEDDAERPRKRDIYRAPLLVVKELLIKGEPRLVAAVANHDLVFTDAYYGAALSPDRIDIAHLLAAILNSSLASWYFIMTASTFGLWMRRMLLKDIARLPTPDLEKAAQSDAGKNILRLMKTFQRTHLSDSDWKTLDESVLDLYGLDEPDRIVVRDGFFRASWEWKQGRLASVKPAGIEDHMSDYAHAFLSTIGVWLSARKRKRMCAEIFNLSQHDPLRVVRFILEDRPGASEAKIIKPHAPLKELLLQISERLNVSLTDSLTGERELRVYGPDEVVIIKPAARRHWLGVSGLEDADTVIAESITRMTM